MTKEQALNAVEKAIDIAFDKGKELSIHSVISFAKYLNENFNYFDNTDVGDVYKDNDGQGLYSENDIYDEWLNNNQKETEKCTLSSVMALLDLQNVTDLAYKYLDSEQTDGVTSKSEKAHFVQGFMQACGLVKQFLKTN
jgi:hypothetical protein